MRCAGLLFLLVSSAAAQPALFPHGRELMQTAAPHWRASVSGGLSGALTGVAVLGLERTVSGPFSVGGRGVLYSESGSVDDGGAVVGVGGDLLGSVGTRGRALDLRAFAGAGASVVRVSGGSLVLYDPDGEPVPDPGASYDEAFRPHLVGGAGVDLYPFAGVGIGGEARYVVSSTGVNSRR